MVCAEHFYLEISNHGICSQLPWIKHLFWTKQANEWQVSLICKCTMDSWLIYQSYGYQQFYNFALVHTQPRFLKRVSISSINNESIFIIQSHGLLPLKGLPTIREFYIFKNYTSKLIISSNSSSGDIWKLKKKVCKIQEIKKEHQNLSFEKGKM